MTAQNIFYIIASVAMVLFLLAIIVITLVIYTWHRRISRAARLGRLLSYELRGMFQSGRSYGKYLGASLGAGILGKILKSLRQE